MFIVPEYTETLVKDRDPTDRWSGREYTGKVTGATIDPHGGYHGVEVEGDGPWYAVVVGYKTGDTFNTGFAAVVVDAFQNAAEANALAEFLDKEYSDWYRTRQYSSTGGTFTFNGKEYYPAWTGYFEHFVSVGVYAVSEYLYRS